MSDVYSVSKIDIQGYVYACHVYTLGTWVFSVVNQYTHTYMIKVAHKQAKYKQQSRKYFILYFSFFLQTTSSHVQECGSCKSSRQNIYVSFLENENNFFIYSFQNCISYPLSS